MAKLLNNVKYRSALYAFLLFLPTLAGVPVQMYLLFAMAVLILERERLVSLWLDFKQRPFSKSSLAFWLVLIIVLSAAINKLLNGHEIYSLRDYYAPFYLFPLLILTSRLSFRLDLFLFLIVFTALESVVGITEYITGVRSFIMDIGDFNRIPSYDLLYSSRVYGLSANSSVLGQKVLLAFILIDYVKLNSKWEWFLRFLLLAGLIVSFSRIAIILLILYWGATLLWAVFQYRKEWKSPSLIFKGILVLFVVIGLGPVKNQLTRGDRVSESAFEMHEGMRDDHILTQTNARLLVPGSTEPDRQGWGDKLVQKIEGIQSSGRKLIWINYINFIEKNLLFGNGSDKLMFYTFDRNKQQFKFIHAHNSFLQLIASHGLLIASLFMVFYLIYWKRHNLLPVGIICLYCCLNYGIFYGFSYMDVVFLILLFFPLKLSYDNAEQS